MSTKITSESGLLKLGASMGQPGLKNFIQSTNNHVAAELKSEATLSLCEARSIIFKSRLWENQANELLRQSYLPEIAGYLVLTTQADVDVDFITDYNLKRLLTCMIHSEVTGIPIKEVVQGMSGDRPHVISNREFNKFLYFLSEKLFPWIKKSNYQSIAVAMQSDIIKSYPAFDVRTKSLLDTLFREAAETGEAGYLQVLYNDSLKMGGKERPSDYYENMHVRINNFLRELRSAKHVIHPTKYEILLRLFESQDFQPINIDELGVAIFGESNDSERATQFKISRLNARLRPYGIQIQRSNDYVLQRVDNPEIDQES